MKYLIESNTLATKKWVAVNLYDDLPTVLLDLARRDYVHLGGGVYAKSGGPTDIDLVYYRITEIDEQINK